MDTLAFFNRLMNDKRGAAVVMTVAPRFLLLSPHGG
nr:MAG TPA: hypothetical protein [Caudoviricetes sp.]